MLSENSSGAHVRTASTVGATYTSKFVDEEKLENYEPWYLKINAKATLPTLVCGEIVLTDPKAIASPPRVVVCVCVFVSACVFCVCVCK